MVDGLVLVAHGSRHSRGVAEALALGELVARIRPDLVVATGFLELADPPAGTVIDAVAERGCGQITVQPLMLFAAGHSKSDVPALVLAARGRHPEIQMVFGSPLGVVPELLAVAAARVTAAGGSELPLLVIARGTSDPDANAEAARAARLLAEWSGAPDVEVGFTGVTWPSVPDALARMHRLGHGRIALFPWFVATGVLLDRVAQQVAAFGAATGVEVIQARHFGADPGLAAVIGQRRDEAVAGLVRTNCDTCAYRAEWPGLALRLGQPRGVGHSALAAEHRGEHTHHH